MTREGKIFRSGLVQTTLATYVEYSAPARGYPASKHAAVQLSIVFGLVLAAKVRARPALLTLSLLNVCRRKKVKSDYT